MAAGCAPASSWGCARATWTSRAASYAAWARATRSVWSPWAQRRPRRSDATCATAAASCCAGDAGQRSFSTRVAVRSRARVSTTSCARSSRAPTCAARPAPTPSVTRSPRTCSPAAPTCAACRSCSATPAWRPPSSILTSPWSICARSFWRHIRGRGAARPPRPRMCLQKDLAQMLHGDVSIELGGRHAGVAEQLLHAAQVGAAGEQVRGERVTEGVGAGLAAHVGAREDLAQEVVETLARERTATRVEKDLCPASPAQQLAAAVAQVASERRGRRCAHGDHTLLVALAHAAIEQLEGRQVALAQPQELAGAQAAAIEQLEGRQVALGQRDLAA